MDNKTTKMLINVFAGILGFGLGLIVVSLFLSVVDVSAPLLGGLMGGNSSTSASLGLFDPDWDTMDSSPVFIIVSFLVLIIGIAIMSVDLGLKQKAKKQVKGLNYTALAVIFVGFILIIVSTVTTKNAVKDEFIEMIIGSIGDSEEYEGMTNAQIEFAIGLLINFKLGIGAVMAIVGGVFALIGGTLLVLPQFNPIQLSQAPAQPAQPAPATAPATPAAEQPVAEQAATVDPFDNSTPNDTIQ